MFQMCIYKMHSFFIVVFTVGILCIIIGFPTWMCGCNESIGACIKYDKCNALVISNTCYETHGNDQKSTRSNDDK
jgi:hypothetical protein